MEQRRRSVRRILRVAARTEAQEGSTTVEGIAAMAVFFLLLAVIVQIGFAVTARSMVSASVDGAARRAATADDDGALIGRLEAEVRRSVPGVEVADVSIERAEEGVTVSLRYQWRPPGPDLLPIEVTVERHRKLVVPP